MSIWTFLLIVLIVFFAAILLGVWMVGSFIRSAVKGAVNLVKGEPEQQGDLLDVEFYDVPDRGFTDMQKAELAAYALNRSVNAVKAQEELSFERGMDGLNSALKRYTAKDTASELKRIKSLYIVLDRFLKSDDRYSYSYVMLTRAVCGFGELLKAEKNGIEELVAGMMYALEALQYNIHGIRGMADIADECEPLRDEVSDLISTVNKLNWLFLSYPSHKGKHGRVVGELVDSVGSKLKVYADTFRYGVESKEAEDFLVNARQTVSEVNSATAGILNDIINKGLMQADAGLEVLRQDMRMRGLYDK